MVSESSPSLSHFLHVPSSPRLVPHPTSQCFGGANAAALETCPAPGWSGRSRPERCRVAHGQPASVKTSDDEWREGTARGARVSSGRPCRLGSSRVLTRECGHVNTQAPAHGQGGCKNVPDGGTAGSGSPCAFYRGVGWGRGKGLLLPSGAGATLQDGGFLDWEQPYCWTFSAVMSLEIWFHLSMSLMRVRSWAGVLSCKPGGLGSWARGPWTWALRARVAASCPMQVP